MNSVKLSILICSVSCRKYFLDRILSLIEPQLVDGVEIITDLDDAKILGTKRNDMMQQANGEYIVFVDDDDIVPAYYVKETIKALESNPDCTGFKGIRTAKSKDPKIFIHSNTYSEWFEDTNYYYRSPNHWNAVKKELAIKAGFPDINWGEDAEYSKRLKPLLKTSIFIDKIMYYYLADNDLSIASKRRKEDMK